MSRDHASGLIVLALAFVLAFIMQVGGRYAVDTSNAEITSAAYASELTAMRARRGVLPTRAAAEVRPASCLIAEVRR